MPAYLLGFKHTHEAETRTWSRVVADRPETAALKAGRNQSSICHRMLKQGKPVTILVKPEKSSNQDMMQLIGVNIFKLTAVPVADIEINAEAL